MNRLAAVLVVLVIVVGVLGFTAGYGLHPSGGSVVNQLTQSVELSGEAMSCAPSSQPPYLAGVLQFDLTSTYWTDIIVSVAYFGNWAGDTNQLVHASTTRHVTITWGPAMMQTISVTQCPVVGVTIWRIVQTIVACPNPPCDDGTIPAP